MKNNFSENLVRYLPELLNFAFVLTANKDDAHDLVQATSLHVLDNEAKLVSEKNVKGWLYTIMRNLFVNNYRKVVKYQASIESIDDLLLINNSPELICESFESSYEIQDVNKVVNSLNKNFRIPFVLYVSGFKYREISEKMHIPIGTVKSRIYITKRRLRIIFKDYM